MTCYMRHMTWLFEALDLPQDKEQRKRADAALREILGVEGEGCRCPEVWAAIKALTGDERLALVPQVREVLGR